MAFSGTVTIENTAVTYDQLGIASLAGGVQLSNVTVTGNTTGLSAPSTGIIVSFANDRIHNNTTDGAPTKTVYQK